MKSPRWRWKQRLPAKSVHRNFDMPTKVDIDTVIALNEKYSLTQTEVNRIYKAYAPLFNYRKKQSDGTTLYGITKDVWTAHIFRTPPAADLATFVFSFYDQDGDGLISVLELIQVHILFSHDDRYAVIRRLFRALDWRGRGYLVRKDIVDLQLAYYDTLDLEVLKSDAFLTGVRGQEGFWESRRPMSARFPILHYLVPSTETGRMIDMYIKNKYMNINAESNESRKQIIERFGVENNLKLEMLKHSTASKLEHLFECLDWGKKDKFNYHRPNKLVLHYFCYEFYETFADWVRPQKSALV